MKNVLFILCLFAFVARGDREDSALFKLMGLPGQKKRPSTHDGKPVKVYVGFYIQSLGNIEATKMSFDADLYVRMSWQDSRLSHEESDLVSINDLPTLNDIWVPDIYFANAKSAQFQFVTVPNFVIWIENDGTTAYSTRVTMNVACNLHLVRYPLDYQVCTIRVMSYAHTMKEMNVSWFTKDSITINKAIDLAEFKIIGHAAQYCDGLYQYAVTANSFRTGRFSCLIAKIYLKREIGYHLVQTYIPTGLIVIISWVSFWIDRNAVPARVSLSFTTLLTLSTMGAGLRYAQPAVSYAKAIDYWFGMCMIFIFGALLEFAVVNNLMRRAQKFESMARAQTLRLRKIPETKANNLAFIDDEPQPLLERCKEQVQAFNEQKCIYARRALRVDLRCRFVFPLMFLAFNSVYWGYYLYA